MITTWRYRLCDATPWNTDEFDNEPDLYSGVSRLADWDRELLRRGPNSGWWTISWARGHEESDDLPDIYPTDTEAAVWLICNGFEVPASLRHAMFRA